MSCQCRVTIKMPGVCIVGTNVVIFLTIDTVGEVQ
jgi:hypothetical protein